MTDVSALTIDRKISVSVIILIFLQMVVAVSFINKMSFSIAANADEVVRVKVSVVSLRADIRATDERINDMRLQSERIRTQLEYIVLTLDRVDKKLAK